MRALMKAKRLSTTIQKIKLEAARLRCLVCQTNGGRHRIMDINARTGIATAEGERSKVVESMVVVSDVNAG